MADQRNSDELDLLQILKRAIQFFDRYKRVLIVTSIAGALVGSMIYFAFPKKYVSRLILHSDVLTNAEQIQIITSWDDLLSRKGYDAIGKIFNCDPSLPKKMLSIDAEEIQKLYTSNNPNGFVVVVEVTDLDALDGLQKGIIYGLENSGYIKEKVDLKKKELTSLINLVEIEISKLDSTKSIVSRSLNSLSTASPRVMIDVSGLNTQSIALAEKLTNYRDALHFVEAIQVVQGFTKYAKPTKPRLIIFIVVGGIAGLLFGYMVSFVMDLRRRINSSPA